MPTEIIGEFGTPGANSEWLEAEGQLAIMHVKKLCGDPPPELKLEIVWQEHELGNYPTIGLVWDDPMRGTPWKYISRGYCTTLRKTIMKQAIARYTLPKGDGKGRFPRRRIRQLLEASILRIGSLQVPNATGQSNL